jgi:hypothetical protein
MRIKPVIYMLFASLFVWCHNENILCKDIDIPTEHEDIRLFLLKGYASAKSVLRDVRIEFEKTQIPIDPPSMSPALLEKLDTKVPTEELLSFTNVEEYIRKNRKEIWGYLYHGKSSPTENISNLSELIGTENPPNFKVFDGQYILEYYPIIIKDGITKVGRATLNNDKTGLFKSYEPTDYAPVKFFGYAAGLMPDDVLSNPQLKVETKPEIINGILTYKVRALIEKNKIKYNIVYWLSPERSCLPVKTEVERNGVLKRRLETKKFIELEDGRWIIKSIMQRNLGLGEGNEKYRELVNWTYTIRKLELHPKIDEEKIFSTSPDNLPAGVQINDKISGIRYFTDEGPVSDKRIEDIMEESLESLSQISNVTETEAAEETTSKNTSLIDDANKPLFSDKGIFTSQTTNQTKQGTENKIHILSLILGSASILSVFVIMIVVFRKHKK